MVHSQPKTRVVLVDNRDSFTHNIAHGFAELSAHVEILDGRLLSTSQTIADELLANPPSLVCIGPGPRGPRDLPDLISLVRALNGNVPLFGVCLGLQAIVLARGGSIKRAREPVHGMRRAIDHDGTNLFCGLPSPLLVMRYHSLIAAELPPTLVATAHSACASVGSAGAEGKDAHEVMAVQDVGTQTYAVQFHPESVGTAGGSVMLDNVLALARGESDAVGKRPTLGRQGAIPPVLMPSSDPASEDAKSIGSITSWCPKTSWCPRKTLRLDDGVVHKAQPHATSESASK